ncbi:MAG: xanthine dehydrogenase FAD-binding subunit XdhB [Lachnospiraceae bacterium]|nr:xanthine dehydrogenase FAD-binding subunit XdhB [Lachnospiraceae bacterium]
MYDIEKYYNAHTLEEAISLMKEHPRARLICGGSDVLIRIREGKMAGCELIGIREIEDIKGVSMDEDRTFRIGAATTFSHITQNELIKKYVPVLGEAVDQVGGPQVRNIGTIGGNICNGAVSADSAPTCFSLEAQLVLTSFSGTRISSMEDFYLGPGKVNRKEGEILTHILIPEDHYKGYTGHYIKYSMRNAMDIATLSCSVVCKADRKNNQLLDVKITFGVAAPVPLRCHKTEEALKGRIIDRDLFTKTEDLIREEINPRDSWRASKDFRLQIGGEIAKRALATALWKQNALEETIYLNLCGEVETWK